MTLNKLQLNDGKTEILHIHSRFDRSPLTINNIQVGSSTIQPSTIARKIGFTFDSTHDFKKHILQTCRIIYTYLRRISFIRKYLSQDACKKLVNSTISSQLDYSNALLFGLPQAYIGHLQRAQNSAARLITQTRKRDHITPILMHLHWLPVQFRIQYKILLLTFKSLHGLAPQYLADLITINCPTRSLRSSLGITLKVPRTRLKSYGDRSFSYASATLWNQLPIDVRASPSITIFKSRLKTLFFQKAYMQSQPNVQRQ